MSGEEFCERRKLVQLQSNWTKKNDGETEVGESEKKSEKRRGRQEFVPTYDLSRPLETFDDHGISEWGL